MFTAEGWAHFLNILTLPDNIPIVIMVVFQGLCFYYAVKQMRDHDKLTAAGRKEEIYDRMIR